MRDSVFPFIVQETGREPAKLEIEVQVLVKGPLQNPLRGFCIRNSRSEFLRGDFSEAKPDEAPAPV